MRTVPTTDRALASARSARRAARRGQWRTHWEPEDDDFWRTTGKRLANKNLFLSIVTDHVAFCIWTMWTVVVVNLPNAGINLSLSASFFLTLAPNLIGSLLRIPYTFAVPRFGGRAWTTASSLLLLLPALLLALVVPSHWLAHLRHGTQFWVLLACAASAGVGGANFASSMANISHFYPQRAQGLALGLNAAGGNVGVAVSQLLVPLVISAGVPAVAASSTHHQVHLAYAGWLWVPLILLSAVGAWRYMDSLDQAKGDRHSYLAAVRAPQTWLLSLLYIGTFGSFIGYSFALPLVIRNSFPTFLNDHPVVATYLGGLSFLGALVGSLARPLGGWLADRLGGAQVTAATFAGMAAFTGVAIAGVDHHRFGTFLFSFLVLFLFAGMGNGSVYKLIVTVFASNQVARSVTGGVAPIAELRRRAAAAVGIAGAVGALGGVGVQVVLRQASLHVSALEATARTPALREAVAAANASWCTSALWFFLASYVSLGILTCVAYLRRAPSTVLAAAEG